MSKENKTIFVFWCFDVVAGEYVGQLCYMQNKVDNHRNMQM
jgi:hypothetical protein